MTALITGGSKGIGHGIAASLLKEGLNVAITSRRQEDADATARELSKTGTGKIIGIAADVRDFAAQQNAVAKTLETFGRLDVLIANAGVGHFAPITQITPEQWHETIDTNLTGVFYSLKAAVDALTNAKGYFISIASLAGTNFFRFSLRIQRQQIWFGGLHPGGNARLAGCGCQMFHHHAGFSGLPLQQPRTE